MAGNALIDETIPADRADLHAGVAVSRSADKSAGGASGTAAYVGKNGSTRQSNANPSAVLLADFLRPRPETSRDA
jgi:hypothetical protein